jgi:hypothetical protein
MFHLQGKALLDLEDEGTTIVQNVGSYLPKKTVIPQKA